MASRHIRPEALLLPSSVLAKTLPSDHVTSTTGQQQPAVLSHNDSSSSGCHPAALGSSTLEAQDQAHHDAIFLRYRDLLGAAVTEASRRGSSSEPAAAARASPEGSRHSDHDAHSAANQGGPANPTQQQSSRSGGLLLSLWRGSAGLRSTSNTGSTSDGMPPEQDSGGEVTDWFARSRRGALTGVGAAGGAASTGGGPPSAGSHRIQEVLNKPYLGHRQQQGGWSDGDTMPQGAAAGEGEPSQLPSFWGTASSHMATAMLAVAVVVMCGAAVLAAHQPEQQQQGRRRQQ